MWVTTRSLGKFLESRQFYCTTTVGLCEYADSEHPSIEPPSEVTLQPAGETQQRGYFRLYKRNCFFIYLLSSLRCELSALSSEDRKEMEKFRS